MSAVPSNGRLLSLDDWEAMPEDNSREYELVEGVLRVNAKPVVGHQRAMFELGCQLRDQLPRELRVQLDTEMLINTWPATVRVPDLMVVPRDAAGPSTPRITAADVLLAVEIISPGSKHTETTAKFIEYADAGIKNYWIVDITEPVSISTYRLVEDDYKLDSEDAGIVSMPYPAPLTLNLTELLA